MNVRTALISSALLLAVLGWACEQQGPTTPSALATPGGGSLGAAGGVSLDAAGGAISGVKPTCPGDHPSCKDEEPTVRPTYTVTVTGGISGSGDSTPVRGDEIIVNFLTLDLTFFQGKVTCALGTNLETSEEGTLTILAGDDHLHLGFSFVHNEADHHIDFRATKLPIWPPTAGNDGFLEDLNGEWALTTKGKNHQDGCTGEGGGALGPANAIDWMATVALVP